MNQYTFYIDHFVLSGSSSDVLADDVHDVTDVSSRPSLVRISSTSAMECVRVSDTIPDVVVIHKVPSWEELTESPSVVDRVPSGTLKASCDQSGLSTSDIVDVRWSGSDLIERAPSKTTAHRVSSGRIPSQQENVGMVAAISAERLRSPRLSPKASFVSGNTLAISRIICRWFSY